MRKLILKKITDIYVQGKEVIMGIELETLDEGLDKEPSQEKMTTTSEPWRWQTNYSKGWQTVQNEEHARLLIRAVDEDWPWLVIEKGGGSSLNHVQVLHARGGLVVELNTPMGLLSRVTHSQNTAKPISINIAGLTVIATTNEILAPVEAVEVCLEWLQNRKILAEYKTKTMVTF